MQMQYIWHDPMPLEQECETHFKSCIDGPGTPNLAYKVLIY